MGSGSFLQSSFLGGLWSGPIQGNMDSKAYKDAMNVCINAYAIEEGAWTRRQGTKLLGITRGGTLGRIMAFDFTPEQPYQLELTSGWLRAWNGLSLSLQGAVETFPYGGQIFSISTATPAVVTTIAAHNLVTGNQVIASINRDPPSAPSLANRQLSVTVLSSTTFSIADAATGTSINGSTLGYTSGNTVPYDTITKIWELETSYGNGDLPNVRLVSNEQWALLLCGPYVPFLIGTGYVGSVLQGDNGTFSSAFPVNTFLDGPYLDVNSTACTVTANNGITLPGATVKLTFYNGAAQPPVNSNTGFSSSDIGRCIRVQGGPFPWNSTTSFPEYQLVLGSDNNIYKSNIASNMGNDPTTDFGVNWTIQPNTVVWAWGTIYHVESSTVIDVQICGTQTLYLHEYSGTSGFTTQWALGVYGGPNGYPTGGVYHEGRLWLYGAVPNRVDASTPNNIDPLLGTAPQYLDAIPQWYFTPTLPDGTVTDACAIEAAANADENNTILWMVSDQSGVIFGTKAGEWLIHATTLDEPLTPSSIQMRRFSKYGCAPIEPARANRELIFVQRQQRKLLELGYYPYGEVAGYYAPNMTKFVEALTVSGIAEVRWQADQVPIVWTRFNDGSFAGVTYKHAPSSGMGTADTFTAWHGPHTLGSGRSVNSISTGPDWTTLNQSLYMTTSAVGAKHWVEALTPQFDDALPNWAACFMDASINPVSSLGTIVGGGNYTPTGITFYGYIYAAGKTVSVFLGGLYLGDYVVGTDGSVTVVYGTPAGFTHAFVTGLNGNGYGLFGVPVTFQASGTPTYNTYTIPVSIGFNYTSQGQLLRPDFGEDAGTRMGPAFGKKRRIHSCTFGLWRSQAISVGTDFAHLLPMNLTPAGTDDGVLGVQPPTLFSDLCWTTIDDEIGFASQICWQISTPYPCTVQAIEGYLQSADK